MDRMATAGEPIANDTLDSSEARFRALAESSPDAVWVGVDARCVYANAAAARLLGAENPEALIGLERADVIVAEDLEVVGERAARILAEEAGPDVSTFRARRLDGTVVEVEAYSGRVSWEGRPAVQVVFRDITARQRMAESLRASEARQRFLLTLSDRLRPLGDPQAIQREASRILGTHTGASRVGYAEILPDGETSVVTVNYTDGVRGIEGRYRVADFSPALIAALHEGRTVTRCDVANDLTLTDEEKQAHIGLQVGATVDVPLLKERRPVAVLFMHFREAHDFTGEELALIEAVAERTWDAVERARAEVALRASEASHRLALDVAELGTWSFSLVDGSGHLDERAARIVGLPAGETADAAQRQAAGTHPDDLAPMQAAVGAGIASGEPFELNYRVVHPDGSVRHVTSRALVLKDDAGNPVRLVGTNRDVTAEREAAAERERLLAEAESARREAEAANRVKSDFLAVMSHELRTPLNAIGGYAELIEMGIRGPITDAQREDLRRIQQSQRHLLGLINEVLNYAKLESGALQFDLADVPLREAFLTAEALVAPQARTKGLTLVVSECPADRIARADAEKLRQILANLLSNAVKFTEPGGCVALDSDARDGQVCIRVRDSGIGIPAEKLSTIFDPFVQVQGGHTRTTEGTGLGLAISRDLARAMGGDLEVQSALGVGSTFTLLLPAV